MITSLGGEGAGRSTGRLLVCPHVALRFSTLDLYAYKRVNIYKINFYHHCSIPSLFSLLVEYFSDNKFSNVPSFSIHFKVLKFYVRNQIWSFWTFTTHSRVINSRIFQAWS